VSLRGREGEALLQVGAGWSKGAYLAQEPPHHVMGSQEEDGVMLALRQVEELLGHGLRCLALASSMPKPEQPL
jgi:hypothetical protein